MYNRARHRSVYLTTLAMHVALRGENSGASRVDGRPAAAAVSVSSRLEAVDACTTRQCCQIVEILFSVDVLSTSYDSINPFDNTPELI